MNRIFDSVALENLNVKPNCHDISEFETQYKVDFFLLIKSVNCYEQTIP